jgi:long-subunit fatty acid transport protein
MPTRRPADIGAGGPSRLRRRGFCSAWLESSLGLLFFVTAALIFARPCPASQLLASSAGAPDTALSGSTVAEPRTPSAAMFSNPAGLSLFEETTFDSSAAFSFADTRVNASAPSTYDETNSVFVISPGMGLVVPGKGSWSYGFALYGSVGNEFDFDADPAAGVENRFFSEAGIMTFGAGLAYRFNDRLSVGAAITPLFGLSRMRYTLGGLRFKYKLKGPGVQGMLGLRWEPRDGLAVGLGVRTPGRVWMDGSMPFGGGRQDIDLELEMPAQVFAGVSKRLGERVIASLAVRWTDSSSFGDSMIEFEETEFADSPFVPRAKDEWLVSASLEYVWTDFLTLRLGAGHSNAIVGEKGVSPLVYDAEDTRVAVGFSLNFDRWSLDFMGGHAFRGSRNISADEALILPGRYSISGQIAMIGFTWRH